MNTRDEKFAVINLALPGRVLPLATDALSMADLMHLAGTARQFYDDAPPDAAPTVYTGVAAPFYLTRHRRYS